MTAVSHPHDVSAQSADAARTIQLARRWRHEGDREAREQLFVRFLPLARKLAGRYPNAREPREDLVQVAAIGLLGAIDRFDPNRETRFSSFAVPTILGELRRHFRDTGWAVHVPRGAQELAQKIDRASVQISIDTGRQPPVAQLAEYLEISVEEVLEGLDAGTAHFASSLDAPATTEDIDGIETVGERLGSADERYGLVDAQLSLSAGISRLPYLERRALSLRIDSDMKQTDIAAELGCSQMQVSRLLRRAAGRLHEFTDPAVDRP
jgi:RNA polymerase sigma-B factor